MSLEITRELNTFDDQATQIMVKTKKFTNQIKWCVAIDLVLSTALSILNQKITKVMRTE